MRHVECIDLLCPFVELCCCSCMKPAQWALHTVLLQKDQENPSFLPDKITWAEGGFVYSLKITFVEGGFVYSCEITRGKRVCGFVCVSRFVYITVTFEINFCCECGARPVCLHPALVAHLFSFSFFTPFHFNICGFLARAFFHTAQFVRAVQK